LNNPPKKLDWSLQFSFTLPQKWLLRFYLFLALKLNNFRGRLVKALEELQVVLANETEQSKEMLRIYFLQSQGKASPKEIKIANKQFRDLLRSAGLGVVLVLPFSPITLPLIIRLGRRLGIEVLPDSLRDFPKSEPKSKLK